METDFYTVGLNQLKLSSYSVVSDSSSFGTTIVDSGTTLTLLPQSVYNSLKSYFQTYYSYLPLVSGSETMWYGSEYCLLSSSTISNYPTLYFVFDGATVAMPPQNYLYQTLDTKNNPAYCFGISPSTDGNTVLGDTFMRGLYVIFNQQTNQVGFGLTNAIPPYPISSAVSMRAFSLVVSLTFLCIWLY